jgi:hypothetical protein
MCFSATASFATAAATTVVGVGAISQVTNWRSAPLASIPILFAFQQVAEGAIWVLLAGGAEDVNATRLAHGFLLFALVMWPVFMPIAVLLVETDARRRRILRVMAFFAPMLSAYLYMTVVENSSSVAILNHSISYAGTIDYLSWKEIPYLLATCGPLFLSSHRMVRLFGTLVLIAFAVSIFSYGKTLVSVWCFFAAANSTLLYLHFRREAVETGDKGSAEQVT